MSSPTRNQDFALLHPDTIAIRSGHERTAFQEHGEPIFTTSSFVFGSASEAAARFSGDEEGYIYSRFTNPTVDAFQNRLALLEGAEACIATASGMSAILATVLSSLESGDHIVSSKSMFGSTVNLFDKLLPKLGISVSWVAIGKLDEWEQAITAATRMLFVETPTNPLTQLADIEGLASLASDKSCILVVDNCFCTPALQKPLLLGADVVIHSATKFIDGQGRCVGGAVAGSEEFIEEAVFGYMRSAGPALSPFNAWVFHKGLETLSLRMNQHCSNAMKLAEWLQQHPAVARVHYPGLKSHPQHELAKRQQSGFGAVVSMELGGGKSAAWSLIDNQRLMSITANLGDAKTSITHPATTTHARMSQADRHEVGVTDSLVRIAAGLEHVDDIIRDLDQALAAKA
ncbi:MAG: O-succinylhomoserine sulfhydrylase [Gammaproteobacteria bacterium]|nr:O-succinylhomoserine sulfhydrylase [Gammaproteobacteria bacterium]